MAEGNFEKAGLALEIKGFTEYIKQLKEVDDAHISTSVNAEKLTERLTNLEKVIKNALTGLAKIRFDSDAMGFKDVTKDMDNTGEAATEFAKDMSEAAKALRKLDAISASISTFEKLTLTLIQNTGSLQAGFDRIQAAIKDIDMDKLTDSAAKAADSIQKLATAMGNLETSMGGNKLVSNLGKLIPLLLAAGDIKKLSAVGKGIASIVTSLSKIDAIPDFAKNQENFNGLIRFIDRLSLLRLPPALPQSLEDLGDALRRLTPGVKEINKVKLEKHTTDGIDALLTTMNKFSGINTSGFGQLADGIEKLALAFRTFGGGGLAGERFTGTAVKIAEAVEHILRSLNAFVSQADAPTFIKMIGQLGESIKLFAQGMGALGRDFANTMANVPGSITIITQSITELQQSISKIKDVDVFSNVLKKLGDGAKALQSGFSAIGRSKTLREDLTLSIKSIIDAISKLSSADIQNASLRIQGLVGPITQLAEALKILRKQRISDKMVTSFRDLAGEVGILERAVRAVSATLQGFAKAIAKTFASLSKLAIHGLANTLVSLRKSFQQLAIYLLKLPFTIVVAGFKLLSNSLNLLFAPIRFLIDMLGKLRDMLGSLFKGSTGNVGGGLGLGSASQDVKEFESNVDRLQSTLYRTDGATKSGADGFRILGDSADKASADVLQLDSRLDSLNNRGGTLSRIFGNSDMGRMITTFSAANIAADLVTDSLYGMVYGFRNVIGEAITATSQFEQITLQLTSLQAKEVVGEGLFPDVPTALIDGAELLQGNVDELISSFRILAIQSPFETNDVVNAFKTAQAFGFATDEAKALVTTLVDAGSALGFAGNDLKEVARIFGQIRTLGKIQAEDMNQLSERGIGVREALIEAGASAEDVAKGTVKADFALRVLTNTLNRDFTGAALRSANSIEGLLGSFRSFREEALRTFSQPIVEMLKPLAVGLGDALFQVEVFDKIEASGTKVALAVEKIIINVATIAGVVKNAFDSIPQPIKDFVGLLAQATGAALAATTAIIALQAALGLVAAALAFAFVSNPIGQLTALIFIGVTAMNTLQSATMSVGETFTLLGSIIKNALSGKLTALDALYDIQRLPEGLRDVAFWLTDISNRISGTLNTLGLFASIFTTAFSFQEDLIGPVIIQIMKLDDGLHGIGLNIAAVGAQLGYFGNIIQEIALILMDIVDPEDMQTVVELFNMLPTSIQDAVKNAGSALQGFLNIFINWRANLVSLFGTIYIAASNLGQNIGNGIQQAASNISSALFNIAVGANSIIQNFFGTASAVTDFLTGLIENIYMFGSGAISAFADGMMGAVNLVVRAVQAIADAISWLLAPGSPPRALPNIDKWGEAAAGEFIAGMANAKATPITQLTDELGDILNGMVIPTDATLGDLFPAMNWTEDESGNIIDSLGNIILTQDQLAESTANVADELARVNEEISALDKQQSIQKQQNLVNNLKSALSQPGISESNRMVLEQQLKRAELELRKLQLEAEQTGLVEDGTGGGSLGGGSGSGSGSGSDKEAKLPKALKEPEQKFPKIDKAIKKTGKALEDALDLAVPDMAPVLDAFGSPESGDGLLGKVTTAFNDAKKNIGAAVLGIKEEILRIFGELRSRLEVVVGEIIRIAGDFGQAFQDAFGNIDNQGPIAGAVAALATATVLSGGWGVLLAIAAGVTAIGGAWALASGQVDLKLPDSLSALQKVVDDMRAGFTGAEGPTFEVARGVFVTAPGKTLAETIMGFDATEFAKSVGALLFSIGQALGNFVTKLDEAIGNALKAPAEGKNPLMAFLQTYFDVEGVKEQIRIELEGLGTLIGNILSGELTKTFSGSEQSGMIAMSAGGDSVIANFIIAQISRAGEVLATTDYNAMFADAKLKFQEAINGIFTMPDVEGLDKQAMGLGEGGTGGISPVLDNIFRMFEQIGDIAATDTDVSEFGGDLKELGVALGEFGVSVGTLSGVVVGVLAAISIIGTLEVLTKTPSIAESALQIIDNFLRTVANLVRALSNMDDPVVRLEAFGAVLTNFKGIFEEINELQDDAFSIISGTVDGMIRLVAAITGVQDAEKFANDSDIISSALVSGITAILGVITSIALSKAAAAMTVAGPKILEIIKGLPRLHLLIIGLSTFTAAVKEFDEKNQGVDLKVVTDFLDQLNGVLIAYGTLQLFGLTKFSDKIILKALASIGSILAARGLISTKDFGPQINLWNRITNWIVGPFFSRLKQIAALGWGALTNPIATFSKLTTTITGALTNASIAITQFLTGSISASSATAVAGIVGALALAVTAIIGAFVAFQKDIGGLRTETVLPAFEALTTFITKVFAAFGDFFSEGLSLDAAGAQARADANVQVINAFSGLVDSFVDILGHHDGSAIQTIADTFASAMGGVIDMVNSLMGTEFETDLTGDNNPLAPVIDFMKGIEEFVVASFTAISLLNSTDDAVTVLDKINAFVEIITAFANLNPLVKDVDLSENSIVESITELIDVFIRLSQMDLGATDEFILGILAVTDAIGFLSSMNLDKVGAAVRIVTLLMDSFFNPRNAVSNAITIGTIISNVTSQINNEVPELESGVERYLQAITRAGQEQTITPPIKIDPIFEFDTDVRGDTGWFTPETFGGSKDGLEVPITVVPSFDSTEFESSGSFGQNIITQMNEIATSVTSVSTAAQTDVTTAFTTMNTNVNTQTTTLKSTVDTSFLGIAGSIIKGAADGALGFVTELGLLPEKTEEPMAKTIEKLDGNLTDFSTSGEGLGINFADGLIIGMQSKQTDVRNAAAALGAIANLAVANIIQSASPSKVMIKEGKNIGLGLTVGMDIMKGAVHTTAKGLGQRVIDGVIGTVGSSENKAAIARVLAALLPDSFQDKGLKIDFSNWEIVSDSETDVAQRALKSATNIAEQFGNSFARVTNQIFDEVIASNSGLAPSFFNSEEINAEFTKQIDGIFKHRQDTLEQFGEEGKAIFDRNFLAAFTNPEGVQAIAKDFLAQFSDDDFFNLPKIYGAIDGFVGSMRARLQEQANAGDGWAMSMLGGLDNLDVALKENVQTVLDEMSAEGEDAATGASSVGSAVSTNIAAGTVSPESLGGLNTAVTTLTATLVTTIQTEFAKITAIVSGQGAASSQGFITGINLAKELLPVSKDEIIKVLEGFTEEFVKTATGLGDDWSAGYAAGMITEEALKLVYEAGLKVGQTAKKGTADGQNSASPSKDAMKLGRDFGDGYVNGILASLNNVRDAGIEMTAAAAQAINEGMTSTAPILTNALETAVKQGNFWIDSNAKYEPPVAPEEIDKATESMNALERATEAATQIFDSFGDSFSNTFDNVFDKFFENNPDAIKNIWDIESIREAGTSVATDLRDMFDEIGSQLTPSGQSKFSDVIKQMFGDEETISTLVGSFIDSFSAEELANLPDAAAAIDTFVRQIEDVLLEDDEYEGWLKEMGLTDDIAGGFTGITETLKKEIQATLDAIKEAEEEAATPQKNQWLVDMFGDYQLPTEEVGQELTEGIAAGITSPESMLALSSAAQTAIDLFMTELRNAGDIHSPSRLTMRLAGEPLVDGIIVGMRNRLPDVISTAKFIGDKVANSFGSRESEFLQHNTVDQGVNLKYNGLVSSLPELFQKVNGKLVAGAGKLGDNIMMAGNSNARTGMLTNHSIINNTSNTQDEYHLHMDVKPNQVGNVRRNFRVAKQLGIS